MRAAVRFLAVTAFGYALFEVYLALRPDDLTDQFRSFLATRHGQFESYYAERRDRTNGSDRPGTAGGIPLGD